MTFPTDHGPARDEATLAFFQSGQYYATWATVTSSIPGHTAVFRIMADAAAADGIDIAGSSESSSVMPGYKDRGVPSGTYNRVRLSASAYVAQQVADLLGCSLLTPKLADILFLQRRVTLLPMPMVISSTTRDMVRESLWIDKRLRDQNVDPTRLPGLVSTVGKHWVLDKRMASFGASKAFNYGWHFPGASFDGRPWGGAVTPPLRLIQDIGWAHDPSHVDYSQNIVLVSRNCIVDGQPMDLRSLLTSPELAPLASHEGALSVLRQPGPPELQPIVKSPCVGSGCPDLVAWTPGNQGETPEPEGAPPSSGGMGNVVAGLVLAAGAGAVLAWAMRA